MTNHKRFCGLMIVLALLLITPLSVCAQDPVQQAAEAYFSQGPRMITATDLFANLHDGDGDNDPYIISVRSAEDYAKGHIATAVHMDATSLFTLDSLATLPPDRDIVVVCYTGQSACQVTSALNILGYNAFCLTHGMSSWTADPDVFVKRFDSETHASDFAVDAEEYLPGGPYSPPAPLAANLRSAADAYFSQGARMVQAADLFEREHGYLRFAHPWRAHLRHRRLGDLPLVDCPLEERPQAAVTIGGRSGFPPM